MCALQRAVAPLRHGQVSAPRGRPQNGLVAAADIVGALADELGPLWLFFSRVGERCAEAAFAAASLARSRQRDF